MIFWSFSLVYSRTIGEKRRKGLCRPSILELRKTIHDWLDHIEELMIEGWAVFLR